jgi:glutamine synthetase type III
MKINSENKENTTQQNTTTTPVKKKRATTSQERIQSIDKIQARLTAQKKKIKSEGKAKELAELRKLHTLIGKAVFEDLKDTKDIDENEYTKQAVDLNRILKSKITTKGDVSFLQSKDFIVE